MTLYTLANPSADLAQKFQITTIHQIPPTLYGAADAIAQIFTGIVPVRFDAFGAE